MLLERDNPSVGSGRNKLRTYIDCLKITLCTRQTKPGRYENLDLHNRTCSCFNSHTCVEDKIHCVTEIPSI